MNAVSSSSSQAIFPQDTSSVTTPKQVTYRKYTLSEGNTMSINTTSMHHDFPTTFLPAREIAILHRQQKFQKAAPARLRQPPRRGKPGHLR